MQFHPSSSKPLSLRFTAFRTLLSKGFLLGSLVEERIPVPQLLARVFLQERQSSTFTPGTHGPLGHPVPSVPAGRGTEIGGFKARNWKLFRHWWEMAQMCGRPRG